jgi:hypothetical protein
MLRQYAVDRKRNMNRVSTRFKVGEDVTTRITKPDVPAGTFGTIVQAYGSKCYGVLFDRTVAFMRGYELAPVSWHVPSQSQP